MRGWLKTALLHALLIFAVATTFGQSSAYAQSNVSSKSYKFYVLYEEFEDHDKARDYILNYDLNSVIVYSEGLYFVAKGPLTTQEQISSAIAEVGRKAREQGICRRFDSTPAGRAPRGYMSTGFKRNYSDYDPQKYLGITEVNLNDDRPIPVFDLSGISAFLGTRVKFYQAVECPVSEVNRDFWELTNGEMSRQYLDITDIRQSGNWRSIDVIQDYDYAANARDDKNNKFNYFSKQFEYVFECDLEEVNYAIIQNEMYFIGGFTQGEMMHHSEYFRVSDVRSPIIAEALFKVCSMPSRSAEIQSLAMYAEQIAKTRAKDEELAAKAYEESVEQAEYEEANAPRGYFLSCSGDEEYQNTIVRAVNCKSYNSILSSLQWAWQTLRQQKPEFEDTCYDAILQLKKLASTAPHVIPDAASGFLTRCNIGLAWVNGPSKAQSARRAK